MSNNKKLEDERLAGDFFVTKINQEFNRKFKFKCRGEPSPDLIYSDGNCSLLVEVTSAYSGFEHAKFINNDLKIENSSLLINEPNKTLLRQIRKIICQKSLKQYSGTSILIIVVPPTTVLRSFLEEFYRIVDTEFSTSFLGIYLVGAFSVEEDYSGNSVVIPIKRFSNF